jgi:hypothetical protein
VISLLALFLAIPSDRLTLWNPGVTSGIPARTTVCATLNPGANIQSALDSCPVGQVVFLNPGSFTLSAGLKLNKGIVLRGSGAGVTILKRTTGWSEPTIRIGTGSGFGTSLNLTQDGIKESFSVTLNSVSGLSVGKLVLIDKKNDSTLTFNAPDCDSNCQTWFSRPGGRQLATINKIASISGNTVTFVAPLHILWDVAHNAQVTPFTAIPVFNAGVESLTLDGSNMPSGAADGTGNVMFNFAEESWTKNIDSGQTLGGYHLFSSFRCTVQSVYSHDTRNPTPGGEGYSFDISQASSENLLTDSISVNFNKVLIMRGAGQANVVSYNYFDHGYISYSPGWNETGINQGHMTDTAYTLFEGNYGFNCDAEIRWGSSNYGMFFRNHCSGVDKGVSAGNAHAAKIDARNYFYTFAGNVLGTSGVSTNWTYEGNGTNSIFALGYPDPGGTPGISGTDSNVKATLVRIGNFDYKSNAVVNPDSLPNSLYNPGLIPWVTPESTTKLKTLWAKVRYDAGTPNAVNSVPSPSPTATPFPTPTPVITPTPTPTTNPPPTPSPTPLPTPTPGTGLQIISNTCGSRVTITQLPDGSTKAVIGWSFSSCTIIVK